MALDPVLVKPRDLPAQAEVFATDALVVDNGAVVGKATPVQVVDAGAPVASAAEAIAGTDNTKRMTPLTVRQVLDDEMAPSIALAQAWAESATNPDPFDVTSKSAKTWAGEAETSAIAAEFAADAAEASVWGPRSDLVTWVSLNTPVNDRTYIAGGLLYIGSTGATEISDLPGLLPVEPQPGHYGIVGDVLIPTHFATLQAAIDAFGESPPVDITLMLEADHRPTTGISVSLGSYDRYTVSSEAQATAAMYMWDPAHIPPASTSAITTLTIGETLTQATSGATAVVVSQGGYQNRLILADTVTGTFNTTDQITGSVSGALGATVIPMFVRQNVVLCPVFSGAFITGTYAALPTLNCLIAGPGKNPGVNHGYQAIGSTGYVTPGSGVIGAWQNGLQSYLGGDVKADSAVFSCNAQNNTTSANAISWAAKLSAENLVAVFSGYYGIQAAHGGLAGYKASDASYAFRYGVRGSDGGFAGIDGMKANNCGLYGFYGFNGSVLSGDTCEALNCGTYGAVFTGVSQGNIGAADLSGGTVGLYAAEGASVTVFSGIAAGNAVRGVLVAAGAQVNVGASDCRLTGGVDSASDLVVQSGGRIFKDSGTLGGNSQTANQLLPAGLISDSSLAGFINVSVTANFNNWNPDSANLYSVINAVPTAERQITGLVARAEGTRLTIINTSPTNTVRFLHQSTSSDVANRLTLPFSQALNIRPYGSMVLTYTNGSWVMTGGSATNTPVYTVATLPSAETTAPPIYVSDEVGGYVMAFSNGTNWLRCTDRAVVS